MQKIAYSLLAGVIITLCDSSSIAASEPLTPAKAIETTRFLGQSPGDNPVALSPSGKRYAIALLTGDVERNGNWLTIISGETTSLESAKPEVITRIFGRNLGSVDSQFKSEITTSGQLLYWIDDEYLGFVWEDEENRSQFRSVNVLTKKLTQITNHPTSIFPSSIGIGPEGEVLYAAIANDKGESEGKFERMVRRGFVVHHDDAFALMAGLPNNESFYDRVWGHKWFYKKPGRRPEEITIAGRRKTLIFPNFISISPDGKTGLIEDFPAKLSRSWNKYQYAGSNNIKKALEQGPEGPKAFARLIYQFFVIDLETKEARPLWGALATYNTDAVWSPDSKRLLIGPTSMPPDVADQAGLEGRAFVEFDLASGKFRPVPVKLEGLSDFRGLRWISPSTAEITTKDDSFTFRKENGTWEPLSNPEALMELAPSIKIEIQSDLNSPPVLTAVDKISGQSRTLLDPNPDLSSKFKLGRVEEVEWTAEDGSIFEGRLYYPVDYETGKKFPFVIQAYSIHDTFSLYGFPEGIGIGPGSGVYIAQMLAGRNIGVLQICEQTLSDKSKEDAKSPGERAMACSDGGREWLLDKGLADPARIGLLGFSATGYTGQFALAHSDFVYAAAIMADNIEGSYVENTLIPGITDRSNGGVAFGAGLKGWLETAPAFSVERIYTPLMKMRFSTGEMYRLATSWEIFSRLRRLNHPVEFYVMPDARDHGSHHPQNPRQVAAIQNRALDWWLFWLKDEEDPDPAKAGQYVNWRKLREQRDALWKKPRPPELEWTAKPVVNSERENR